MLHEAFGLVDTIKIEAKKARELAELQIKLHEGIIMMLTEEEKESITRLKFKSDTYSLIVAKLISRLVKENEELQEWKYKAGQRAIENINLRGRLEPVEAMREDYKFLQSQLDAIKKAWGPLLKLIPIELCNTNLIGDGNYVNAKIGDLKALDKLIGGEK